MVLFDKPQETSGLNALSALSAWYDFLVEPATNVIKKGIDAGAQALGIDTEDEFYQAIRDTSLDVGTSAITSAATEKEAQAAKDNLVKQAESILSQYNNMNCDTMTDDAKRRIASDLAQYTGMFETLGILDKLIPIIQKYNIPSCKLPDTPDKATASSTDSKKMLVPAGVGVAAYYFKESWLLSIAVAAAAGGATYYFMNQGVTNAKA